MHSTTNVIPTTLFPITSDVQAATSLPFSCDRATLHDQDHALMPLPLTRIPAPPCRAIHCGHSIRSIIASHYSVPPIVGASLFTTKDNDVYRIACADQSIYYARLCAANCSDSGNTAYLTALLEYAASRGAPVARPLLSIDGMTFLTVAGADGLREFSVYPQIEGSTLTNTSYPRETGATLAAFHLACEGYQGPKSVRIRDLDAIVHRSTSHIAQCAYLDDSIKSACLRTAKRLEDKLRALHLTTGHCHHDWDKNVIGTVGLRGSISQITIIDFDTVGPGVLASDFVNLFADFHPTTRAPTNDQPDPQWKILLQGYCEKKPLHKDDISSIPIFSAFAKIRSLNRRILEIDTYGLAALLNFPEQWQKRADYLEGVKPM